MIEILLSNGDWAEAEDPAGAVVAARTMMEDAADATSCPMRLLRATFVVDGRVIASDLRRADILGARSLAVAS